jgi:hypothetical protein
LKIELFTRKGCDMSIKYLSYLTLFLFVVACVVYHVWSVLLVFVLMLLLALGGKVVD